MLMLMFVTGEAAGRLPQQHQQRCDKARRKCTAALLPFSTCVWQPHDTLQTHL